MTKRLLKSWYVETGPYAPETTFTPNKFNWAFGGVLLGVLILPLNVQLDSPLFWLLMALGLAVLIALRNIRETTVIDAAQKGFIHKRTFRLLNLEREIGYTPFNECEAVVYWFRAGDPGEWWVGIRTKCSRRFWIRQVPAKEGKRNRGREVESVAWRLSCDTGLEIDESSS